MALSAQNSDTECPPCEGQPISRINVQGLDRTRPYIVDRQLKLTVGAPYSRETAEADIKRLERLDIFAHMEVQATVDRDSVIVTYDLVESLFILPTLALRISDDTGVSAGGGVKFPNLMGKDIFCSARVLVGGATEVELWIENPWAWGNHIGYKLEYYLRDKENKVADFQESANEVYLSLDGRLGEFGRMGATGSFLSIAADRDNITLNPDRRDDVASLGLYMGLDNVDAYIDPSRGWFLRADLSRHRGLGDNPCRYDQLDFDIRRYSSLAPSHTLAAFSLTTLRSGKVGHQVAPWQLYGIGGTNTVRGWTFGARSGKNQCLNTLEYRYTLWKPELLELPLGINYRGGLQLAAFGDAGIGWDEGPEMAMNNFIWGYGFGVRFLIPIVSMARVDFGWGEHGKTVFLHMGSFEKSVMARRRVR